jgi:hypothetical protein
MLKASRKKKITPDYLCILVSEGSLIKVYKGRKKNCFQVSVNVFSSVMDLQFFLVKGLDCDFYFFIQTAI